MGWNEESSPDVGLSSIFIDLLLYCCILYGIYHGFVFLSNRLDLDFFRQASHVLATFTVAILLLLIFLLVATQLLKLSYCLFSQRFIDHFYTSKCCLTALFGLIILAMFLCCTWTQVFLRCWNYFIDIDSRWTAIRPRNAHNCQISSENERSMHQNNSNHLVTVPFVKMCEETNPTVVCSTSFSELFLDGERSSANTRASSPSTNVATTRSYSASTFHSFPFIHSDHCIPHQEVRLNKEIMSNIQH